MPRDEPAWWYADGTDRRSRLLAPIGRAYGWIAEARFRKATPYRSRLPVICVGNFTAGGTGKTPLSLLLATLATARGATPVFLTRGYGGRAHGPVRVGAAGASTAAEVGDEPLLLARQASTVVSRDRAAGARYIETACAGASLVIMDDGLQNPGLAKSLTLAVVDGTRGIGNGEIIPAGPLRAPLSFQLGLVDAIIVNRATGGDAADDRILRRLRQQFEGPVLDATLSPQGDTGWLTERPVVAYAGIGNPGRFFTTLKQLGARIAAERPFPDHHPFTERDADDLMSLAARHGAQLVTTEKDLARLSGRPETSGTARRALAEASRPLPVRMSLGQRDTLRLIALLDATILDPQAARTRSR